MEIKYGDPIQVWTFSGWEDVDWSYIETQEDFDDLLSSGDIRETPDPTQP